MAGRPGLYPFQRDGVAALLSRTALLLADDMGTGKTVQAIAALRVLAGRGEDPALVEAPIGLLAQWRAAFSEWAPELSIIRVDGPSGERAWKWTARKRVFLAGYETARNDLGVLARRRFGVVVLDEAQRIKNRDTALSRAMKRLPRTRAWALTGTPLENREDDLASVLEFVRPNPDGARLPPLAPGPALRASHAELQLRRRKADVLAELPPKTVARVPLELSAEQRASYKRLERAARREIGAMGRAAGVMNVLEAIGRLKQVCNFCPDSGRSAKADDLRARMSELVGAGQRALVFSQWTNERFGVERLAYELRAFRPLTYTGGLGAPERERRIAAFRADPRYGALILSLRAGGQGLNLQDASYVVHFDRWWNPAVERQATDRAHRAGQRNPVTVYCYVSAGTIEERIEAILAEKQALFDAVVDGVSLDLERTLTPEELFGLIGLRAPTGRREPAAPDEGDLVATTGARLRGAGWTVRRRPAGHRSSIDLKARRTDEIGVAEELWVSCCDGGGSVQAARVRAIAAALGRHPGVIGALAVRGAVAGGAERAAEAAGVRVWALAA